jgi:dethiobiotin synthetase
LSAVFISGTDTGCGKTRVGCALARALRESGQRVRVLKPVETGCSNGEPQDARALAAAAGDDADLERICPYRLALPAAPEAAARHAGVELRIEPIAAALAAARADADWVIVEGAGGLLVPLSPKLEMAGLVARLGLPLILVARARLGTLNHTLLTLEAARARQLPVLGVAISHTHAQLPPAERQNLELLRPRLETAWLGELAHDATYLEPEPLPRALLAAAGSG